MWYYKNTYAIGGLENIGYADNSDALVVLSTQGRGIFNCLAGERIHRDTADWWPKFDQAQGTVPGFGILTGEVIRTVGLHGDDILSKATADGWMLIKRENDFDDPPFEKYRIAKIFLTHLSGGENFFISKDGSCELRAFGFSPTGNSLVVALTCEIVIWNRSATP